MTPRVEALFIETANPERLAAFYREGWTYRSRSLRRTGRWASS